MSTDKGYIRVYRDIREHWIWDNGDMLRAWLDLIMTANHEDNQFLFCGELITVKRGSLITSVRKLAARWHWGKDRVLKFLRLLEAEGMIDRKADSRKTLITIEKYDVYQVGGKKKQTLPGTLTGTQTGTLTGTQTSHKQYTNEYTIESTKKEYKDLPGQEELEPDDEYLPDDYWEEP